MADPEAQSAPAPPSRRGRWAVGVGLALLYAVLFLPVMIAGSDGASEEADEREYHLPIIVTMAEQWPRVDIVRYQSATSPGFHLLMAAVMKAAPEEHAFWAMKCVNAFMGIGLILAVFAATSRITSPALAAALTLPLMCNPYTLGATIWLTTDNMALLFVALALGGAVTAPYTPWRNVRLGVYAALAVGVRQMHVWLAAPVGFIGLLASPMAKIFGQWYSEWRGASSKWTDANRSGQQPRDEGPPPTSTWMHLVAGVLAAALPVLLLGWFVSLWGDVLPKVYGWINLHRQGPNPAVPAFALTLIASLGVFYAPLAWDEVRKLRLSDRFVVFAVLAGLTTAVAAPTSFVWISRSYGWLWRIIDKFPDVSERSLVITAGAPVGALVLLVMYRAARNAGRSIPARILLLSLLGWLMAQTFNSMCWQRYFEPILLIGLGWLAALGAPPDRRSLRLLAGPLFLALCQFIVTSITLYREAILGWEGLTK